GNKIDKYVQGSPNLFFAIYKDEDEKKSFESIRLDIIIERMKQLLNPVPEISSSGALLFETLSPLDLVYIPTSEESDDIDPIDLDKIDKSKLERMYNVNDFSGVTIYFSQNSFAKNIYPKEMD